MRRCASHKALFSLFHADARSVPPCQHASRPSSTVASRSKGYAQSRRLARHSEVLAYSPIIVLRWLAPNGSEVAMPVSPTQAQSAASRANGALSRGPTAPEGKARPALNGPRHGLRGSTFSVLPDEDPAAWAALLRGY